MPVVAEQRAVRPPGREQLWRLVSVVEDKEEAGLQACRRLRHPARRLQIDLRAAALAGQQAAIVEIGLDLGRRLPQLLDEAAAVPLDEDLLQLAARDRHTVHGHRVQQLVAQQATANHRRYAGRDAHVVGQPGGFEQQSLAVLLDRAGVDEHIADGAPELRRGPTGPVEDVPAERPVAGPCFNHVEAFRPAHQFPHLPQLPPHHRAEERARLRARQVVAVAPNLRAGRRVVAEARLV